MEFGFRGVPLNWFRSYLEGRSQIVQVSHNRSSPHVMHYGVPQGSILGPVLFSLYTSSLGKLINSHDINYMLYADDTQLYVAFDPKDITVVVSKMEICIQEVRRWMFENYLKLNEEKTEVIVFRSKFCDTSGIDDFSLKIGDKVITSTSVVRNLGIYMDTHLSMDQQVNNICKSTMFHVRRVGQRSKYLDRPATEKLIHAVISSRLDYANSLLFGATTSHLSIDYKLSRTQPRELFTE